MEKIVMEKKLNEIENEIVSLKTIMIQAIQQPLQKQIISLKGILKGISVSEEDIKKAKESLFNFDI